MIHYDQNGWPCKGKFIGTVSITDPETVYQRKCRVYQDEINFQNTKEMKLEKDL